MKKEIVVSGTRPTGHIHIGNYFGAIANFVRMQEDYPNNYFFIADLHSLTTHPFSNELPINVKRVLSIYLACGLNPDKSVIYVQSDLPQISELYLILNMFAYKGELEKVPTFKEKLRTPGQTINAGLLTYPVLMAADILIHRAAKVPVGKDQEPHLEMARNFAQRFNLLANQVVFPEPQAFSYKSELLKVPSLDGSGKMSKSHDNPDAAIYLTDSDEMIIKKIKKAKTAPSPVIPNSPIPLEIQNLLDLLKLVSDEETIQFYSNSWMDCTIRFGDLKNRLSNDVINWIHPIREKIFQFENDPQYLKDVLNDGARRAALSANETIKITKELLNIKYF